jgi:hypothetical protein
MDKEVSLTVKIRRYNGDYGIGSIFKNVFTIVSSGNIIEYTEEIGLCSDTRIGTNKLSTIKTTIPFKVDDNKVKMFNDLIEKIKTNPDYKYNESHYAKVGFDHKKFKYADVIIDGEEFEVEPDDIFKVLFVDIINTYEYSQLMYDYYDKMTELFRKENKIPTDDISSLNIPYEDRQAAKLIGKFKEFPINTETTIANLLGMDEVSISDIDPLTQGKVFNKFEEECKKNNLVLARIDDSIGGLAYNYKFKREIFVPEFEKKEVTITGESIGEDGHIVSFTQNVEVPTGRVIDEE